MPGIGYTPDEKRASDEAMALVNRAKAQGDPIIARELYGRALAILDRQVSKPGGSGLLTVLRDSLRSAYNEI